MACIWLHGCFGLDVLVGSDRAKFRVYFTDLSFNLNLSIRMLACMRFLMLSEVGRLGLCFSFHVGLDCVLLHVIYVDVKVGSDSVH